MTLRGNRSIQKRRVFDKHTTDQSNNGAIIFARFNGIEFPCVGLTREEMTSIRLRKEQERDWDFDAVKELLNTMGIIHALYFKNVLSTDANIVVAKSDPNAFFAPILIEARQRLSLPDATGTDLLNLWIECLTVLLGTGSLDKQSEDGFYLQEL